MDTPRGRVTLKGPEPRVSFIFRAQRAPIHDPRDAVAPRPSSAKTKKSMKRRLKVEMRGGRPATYRQDSEDPQDLSSDRTSPCSMRGVSSGTLDADVHTWSTNTTDYDGGASCSSSGAALTSYPSVPGPYRTLDSGGSYLCSDLD